MIMVPEDLFPYFNSAGWMPARMIALSQSVTSQIPPGHPAFAILSAFSGITVGECGAGEECATSDVSFQFVESDDEADVWGGLLGTVLVGIATVQHNHGDLFIDSIGRCFSISAVHDAMSYEGASFGEAIRGLLRGIRCRPMLRPDQKSVTLYGDEFTANSPEVYDYERAI